MSRSRRETPQRREPLRIGFVPTSDCAPLVYAYEAGLFARYGLEVQLWRERSWFQLGDKVVQGELDAAHAPATLPFLANLGLTSEACPCVSGMVMSLQGDSIILSRHLWNEGVRDAVSLREQVYRTWGKRTYTFGVLFSFSAEELLLRQWLRAGGVPDAAVRFVTIPPAQMFPTLKLGYLDGYCVCEPWTAVAVQAGVGVCVGTSDELAPLHPEKVLMVRQRFAEERHAVHERVLAALLEACAFCDQLANRLLLSELLAEPQYVNAPAECIRAGFVGPVACEQPQSQTLPSLTIFHRLNANEPNTLKANWLTSGLQGLLRERFSQGQASPTAPILKNVFRPDIFQRAKVLREHYAEQALRHCA